MATQTPQISPLGSRDLYVDAVNDPSGKLWRLTRRRADGSAADRYDQVDTVRVGWGALDELDVALASRGFVRSSDWQPGAGAGGFVAWIAAAEAGNAAPPDTSPAPAEATGWDAAIALFEMAQHARGYSPRTIENRLELAHRLRRLLNDKPLEEIVKRDLQQILARGIAPSSMQRERTDMQAYFRYLHGEGIITNDPAAPLEKIAVAKGTPRPYTLAQINAMLGSGAYHRTRVMVILGYLHGLRAHEIAKMHGRDVDPDAMTLRVLGKGRKERIIPLHAALVDELPKLPVDGYWFPARGGRDGHIHWKSVSDLMTKAKHRAGITDAKLSGHSLRHSFGTELVKSGADLRTTQVLLGHASLATTEIYVGVDEERLTAASSGLPAPVVPAHSGRGRSAR